MIKKGYIKGRKSFSSFCILSQSHFPCCLLCTIAIDLSNFQSEPSSCCLVSSLSFPPSTTAYKLVAKPWNGFELYSYLIMEYYRIIYIIRYKFSSKKEELFVLNFRIFINIPIIRKKDENDVNLRYLVDSIVQNFT